MQRINYAGLILLPGKKQHMITEEKIKQIRKQLSKGEPEGEIKNGLRTDGYTEDEITALFFNLFPKKTGSVKNSRDNKWQIFILIGACFIIAGGSILAINTWLKQFGIPLIVLGAISLCVNYFLSNKHNEK
jgi:uncharacterized membrane-anchored protein